MSDTIHIQIDRADGSLQRLIGLVERRGFHIDGISMFDEGAFRRIALTVRGRDAARVLSRLVFVSLVIPVLAPLIGSLVLSVASWRGLFLVMAVVVLALLAGVGLGLRESLPPERRTSGRPRPERLSTMSSLA